MDAQQLHDFCPAAAAFLAPLQTAVREADLSTSDRLCMFLAQVAHESAEFTRLTENLNYSAKALVATWPSRFYDGACRPRRDLGKAYAPEFARRPRAIADLVYANRNGNGPTESGDGWRYRGRGLIQITGRGNYGACSVALYGDLDTLLRDPQRLAQPLDAARSAAWFWRAHHLNTLADAGNFPGVTRRINGGLHGQDRREALLARARTIF